jgi:hypothetical protein
MSKNSSRVFVALALGFAFLAPSPSRAGVVDPNSGGAPVSGQLGFGDSAQVAATFLNFFCDAIGATTCPTNSGSFTVNSLASGNVTGSFIPYAGDTGFIKDLSNTGGQPLNQPFVLTNFITFNPAGTITPPDITFTLTNIFLGTDGSTQCGAPVNQSQVPAQVCTPQLAALDTTANPTGISAFDLANTANGSTASFSVSGTVTRISTGAVSNFNGTFSATFTNDPGTTDGSYQAVLAELNGPTHSVTAPYAASLAVSVTPTPEPTTSMLFGSGLLAVAFFLRRRRAS